MPFLPITALYAALLAIVMLYLAFEVVKQRLAHKQGLGYSEGSLLLAGRNHANATEYIPITLILLALLELNGAGPILLHVSGFAFLIARMAHAWGFKAGKGAVHPGRYWGTVVTWLVIFALSLCNLFFIWRYL